MKLGEIMYGDQSSRQKIGWKTKKDMVREWGSKYSRDRQRSTEIDREYISDRKKWRRNVMKIIYLHYI